MVDWSTNADWDAAQSRSRVISRDIGMRSADEVALGLDTNHGVGSDLVSFWHMDDASGSLEEVISGGGATASNLNYQNLGPLGTLSVDFNGSSGYAIQNVASDPTGGGSFSIAAWVDKRALTGDADMLIRNGTTNSGTYFLQYWTDSRIFFGYYYNDSGGYESSSFFHSGASSINQHLIVATYDEAAGSLTVYFDGLADSVSVANTRPALSDNINIGRSPISGNPRYFNGQMGWLGLWDRALSQAEVDEIQNTYSNGSGSLTTATKSGDGAANAIDVHAARAIDTTASLAVNQTHSGGTETQTINLQSGSNSYSLSGFVDEAASDYWLSLDLSTSVDTRSPVLYSARLTLETGSGLAAVDHVPAYSAGEYYDIPLYDETELANAGYPVPHTVRGVTGLEGAFRLLPQSETDSPARYHVGGTTYAVELVAGEGPVTGSRISLPEDTSSNEVFHRQGLTVNPNTALSGVRVRVSELAAGYNQAHIAETDSTNIIRTVDISDVGNGEEVDIYQSLSSATEYFVTMSNNDGDTYTRGVGSVPTGAYPYTSTDIDVIDGIYSNGGSRSTANRYNYDVVQAILPEEEPGLVEPVGSPIHWWPLNDGSGTTATDAQGSDDGVIDGPAWASGTWAGGHALTSSGESSSTTGFGLGGFGGGDYGTGEASSTGGHVDTGTADVTGQFAIAWTMSHQFSSGVVDRRQDPITGGWDANNSLVAWQVLFDPDTDELYADSWDGSASAPSVSMPVANLPGPGVPHRVVLQYDGMDWQIWVDGVLESSAAGSYGAVDTNTDRYLFAIDDDGTVDNFFAGEIDDVVVYDTSLTSQQIADDYARRPW